MTCYHLFILTESILLEYGKVGFPSLETFVNLASKKDMRHLIGLVKASAVLHNLFVGSHTVPKSWLSLEELIIPDFDDELDSDEYLSSMTGQPEGTCCEEIHNFLSALLQ